MFWGTSSFANVTTDGCSSNDDFLDLLESFLPFPVTRWGLTILLNKLPRCMVPAFLASFDWVFFEGLKFSKPAVTWFRTWTRGTSCRPFPLDSLRPPPINPKWSGILFSNSLKRVRGFLLVLVEHFFKVWYNRLIPLSILVMGGRVTSCVMARGKKTWFRG